VVSMLFLATSVVQPSEGPYVTGTINTLRALGTLLGGTVIGQALVVRERWHADALLDRLGRVQGALPDTDGVAALAGPIREQAFVLATADAYRAAGLLALLLIPLVLSLHRQAPPDSSQRQHG